MKTKNTRNRLASLVVESVTALWIVTVLAGWHNTFGLSDRAVLIVLLVAGIILCTTGMEIQRFGWTNPFNLFGSAIGVVIVFLVVAVFTGLSLPGVNSDRGALLVLAALMGLKVIISLLRGQSVRRQPTAIAE